MRRAHKVENRKKLLLALGIPAGILICSYLGISVYFINHFYYGTKINGVNFSMKTTGEVESHFAEQIGNYSLTVEPKEGLEEKIVGSDISIKYKKSRGVKKALKGQNAFLWPSMFWKKQIIREDLGFDYNKRQLDTRIQELKSFQNEGKSDPVNAKPEFDGDKFVVKAEVLGTKVDQKAMQEEVTDAVQRLEPVLDLDKTEGYLKPKYTSESKEVIGACEVLNNYSRASITYDMSPEQEVVLALL